MTRGLVLAALALALPAHLRSGEGWPAIELGPRLSLQGASAARSFAAAARPIRAMTGHWPLSCSRTHVTRSSTPSLPSGPL